MGHARAMRKQRHRENRGAAPQKRASPPETPSLFELFLLSEEHEARKIREELIERAAQKDHDQYPDDSAKDRQDKSDDTCDLTCFCKLVLCVILRSRAVQNECDDRGDQAATPIPAKDE